MPVPPPPPSSYKIDALEVNAKLIDQVAQVQVSQTFVNTGSRPMEVAFVFPLPYDGAIDQMTLLVDGKEYPAKLLDAKDEARRLYEEIVRKNRDPALLEWIGTGMFQTSVFPVPPGAKRTVSLRYSQLCRKQDGLTDFLFPLSTAKYTSRAGREGQHPRDDREQRRRSRTSTRPTHAVEDQAARQDARRRHVRGEERGARRATSACSTTSATASVGTQRGELPARRPTRTATSCCWPAPRSRRPTPKPVAEDGGLRRRPLGQHERQEDRAGQERG